MNNAKALREHRVKCIKVLFLNHSRRSFVLKANRVGIEYQKQQRMKLVLCAILLVTVAEAQRGSYAGLRPINGGNKGEFPTTRASTGLNSRFGEDNSINGGVQQPHPAALGFGHDPSLVNKLSQLSEDRQPFWLLNYQQIEAHRNQPQFTGQATSSRGSFMGRRR
jgi:hypothetical protein